jgi:hypothetical protein
LQLEAEEQKDLLAMLFISGLISAMKLKLSAHKIGQIAWAATEAYTSRKPGQDFLFKRIGDQLCAYFSPLQERSFLRACKP